MEVLENEEMKILDALPGDNTDIIVITQLPIIEDQLAQAKELIDKRTAAAMAMECTEENKKEVKDLRSALNKERKAVEERYKEALDEVIAPITKVQEKFKDCISGYTKADKNLKEKIDTIENTLKERKRLEIQAYFDECAASYGIDFVTLDDLDDVKITLSVSATSLKKKISTQLARISTDLKMIDMQENREEILIEYKKSLNASDAIAKVQTRQRSIQEEKRRRLEEQAEREKQRQAEEKVKAAAQAQKPIQPPTVQDAPLQPPTVTEPVAKAPSLKVFNFSFAAHIEATSKEEAMERLKAFKPKLIEFMKQEGIYYGKQ